MYGDSYLPCDYAAIARNFDAAERAGDDDRLSQRRQVGHQQRRVRSGRIRSGRIRSGRIRNRRIRNRRIRNRKDSRIQQDESHPAHALYRLRARSFSRRSVPRPVSGKARDLAELYTILLERQQLAAFEVHERFYEIGSPTGLQETPIPGRTRGKSRIVRRKFVCFPSCNLVSLVVKLLKLTQKQMTAKSSFAQKFLAEAKEVIDRLDAASIENAAILAGTNPRCRRKAIHPRCGRQCRQRFPRGERFPQDCRH